DQMSPAPDPVKKTRSCCGVRPCCASSRDRNCNTLSACFVLWRSDAWEITSPVGEARTYLQVVLPTSMPQIFAPLLLGRSAFGVVISMHPGGCKRGAIWTNLSSAMETPLPCPILFRWPNPQTAGHSNYLFQAVAALLFPARWTT